MKHFLLTLMLGLISLQAIAQPRKGDYLVGGQLLDFSLKTDDGGTNTQYLLLVSPTVGWLVTDKTVLGLGLPIGLSSFKGGTQNSLGGYYENRTLFAGLSPFVRQYLGSTNVRPFIGAGLTYQFTSTYNRSNQREIRDTNGALGANVNAGVAFFVNRNLSLDLFAAYNRSLIDRVDIGYLNNVPGQSLLGNNSFGIGAGLTIFLARRGRE
jgi:hypothetical protein